MYYSLKELVCWDQMPSRREVFQSHSSSKDSGPGWLGHYPARSFVPKLSPIVSSNLLPDSRAFSKYTPRSSSLLEESVHRAPLSSKLFSPRKFSSQSSCAPLLRGLFSEAFSFRSCSLRSCSLPGASRSSVIHYCYYYHQFYRLSPPPLRPPWIAPEHRYNCHLSCLYCHWRTTDYVLDVCAWRFTRLYPFLLLRPAPTI